MRVRILLRDTPALETNATFRPSLGVSFLLFRPEPLYSVPGHGLQPWVAMDHAHEHTASS